MPLFTTQLYLDEDDIEIEVEVDYDIFTEVDERGTYATIDRMEVYNTETQQKLELSPKEEKRIEAKIWEDVSSYV